MDTRYASGLSKVESEDWAAVFYFPDRKAGD